MERRKVGGVKIRKAVLCDGCGRGPPLDLRQMLRIIMEGATWVTEDLIEKASKLDLEPKPASLWWTSTCASEEKSDTILCASKGCYKIFFEDTFNILGVL